MHRCKSLHCFFLYINDLNENVGGLINTFADYIKVRDILDSKEGCPDLQQDIGQYGMLAKEWQMEVRNVK